MSRLSFSLFFLLTFSGLTGQRNIYVSKLQNPTNSCCNENEMIEKIKKADKNKTFAELADIITTCKGEFSTSSNIVSSLSEWLKENNSIYTGKSFNEVLQFRAYLIYSFSFFIKNETVLKYLIYELNYSDNLNIIGSSIYTSRLYKDSTLNLLIERFTSNNYNVKVNFVDFEIGIEYNTTIQKEAIASLNAIHALEKKDKENRIHSCCSSENVEDKKEKANWIEKKNRKKNVLKVEFLDQENLKCNFAEFIGKPFIITFFYSSCTNQNKCASTVAKLKEFQEKTTSMKNKIGVYLITYDPYVDKPDVLKKYGEAYNFKFSSTSKFLLPVSENQSLSLSTFFNTAVNYGNGIVNQHGTQLYVFDKKGKLAFKFENEFWTVNELIAIFSKLETE
jgi:cytochrome oxidase Cu insertion factor (SCO1/SenC/PrrC family)